VRHGLSLYSFALIAREICDCTSDIRSPDSKPALADDEEEREDHLAILEELERQEIELEQEAARKIQVCLPTLNSILR
jgi:hypothetical protein